jgi:hypothetical protein
MTFEAFHAELVALLISRPSGTSADLVATVVAYWDGNEIIGVRLTPQGSRQDVMECELADEWPQWNGQFQAWLSNPVFSERDELKQWIEVRNRDNYQRLQ